MFAHKRRETQLGQSFAVFELIYHATVRTVRKSHGNAVIGLLLAISQTLLMVVMFFVIMDLLGGRRNAIRGDFLLYVMSGIFVYLTHTKTMKSVIGADGPTSNMMKHAPMTTAISIASNALGALYIQVLSMAVVLFGYHAIFTPITIDQPVAALGMLILAWAYGVAVGMVFLAMKPWSPRAVMIIQMIYARANMLASGKMFLANNLKYDMRKMFDWNPLFHIIDQIRGFVFLNYNPHYTSITYPIYVMLALVMIGLMGEFYTRKHASVSWNAGR